MIALAPQRRGVDEGRREGRYYVSAFEHVDAVIHGAEGWLVVCWLDTLRVLGSGEPQPVHGALLGPMPYDEARGIQLARTAVRKA